MRVFLLFFGFLLLSATFTCNAQENSIFQSISEKLITYSSKQGPEKTYIQTDKDDYLIGETIWHKTYLVDGVSHTSSKKSKVIYLELWGPNNTIVSKQKLYTEEYGAHGDIKLKDSLQQGIYTLRAYTKYMLNKKYPELYTKKISIWANQPTEHTTTFVEPNEAIKSKQEKPLIHFFPEGGNLIYGIENVLGIKVIGNNGNGIALKGKIVDQNNKIVFPFESYDYGLGKVVYTPKENHTYYAHINLNGKVEKYPLPLALKRGYTLNARNKGDLVSLKVNTNIKNGLQGTLLLGHIRGRTFFKRIEKSLNNSYSVKILTKELEDGVAHFTLFTETGEPVCERLVFIDNPKNDISLSVRKNMEEYGLREKVAIELELKDKKGNENYANVSMSIITNTSQSKNSNIKSWLLLNSDINGTIPDADIFFEDNSIEKKNLLDAFMLVHGWRRFVWKNLLENKVSKKIAFEPEKGIIIQGKTTAFQNSSPKKAYVDFKLFDAVIFQDKDTTDYHGNFSFGPYFFQNSITGIIDAKPIAKSRKASENKLAVHVENIFPELPSLQNIPYIKTKTISFNNTPEQEYVKRAYKKSVEDFKYDPNVTLLDEVILEKRKKRKITYEQKVNQKLNDLTIYGEPTFRIFPDSVLGGVPPPSAFGYLIGRGARLGPKPLFLIDGNPVTKREIVMLNPSDILFVDVINWGSARAGIYGGRGGHGVLAFYTRGIYIEPRKPREPRKYPGITHFTMNGFYKAREFYSPDYSKPKKEHDSKDYRTTLHWQPNIRIDGGKKTNLSFFTNDAPGTYHIKIEGITKDGRLINTTKTFEVENLEKF